MAVEKRDATSIKIAHTLWKEAKIEAIRRGITFSDLIENALAKEIRTKPPSEPRRK